MLNNVPVTAQSLGASRDLINQNFSVIDTGFSVNHIQFNDGSGNQGMHAFLQMPSAVPVIATAVNQIGLYCNTGPISGNPELFFQRPGQAANTGYTITERTASSPGWTRLPSGILLKWGTQAFTGTPSATVNINAVGPNFGTVLNIQITPFNGAPYNQIIAVTAQTLINFTASSGNGSNIPNTTSIYYFVIGT